MNRDEQEELIEKHTARRGIPKEVPQGSLEQLDDQVGRVGEAWDRACDAAWSVVEAWQTRRRERRTRR